MQTAEDHRCATSRMKRCPPRNKRSVRRRWRLTGLRSVESFSPDLQRLAQSLGDAYYTLEDVARDVRNYTDTIDFSPRELEDKIARMDVLEKLKRKYGGTLEGVFAHAEKAEQELSVIENDSGDMERLNREKDLNFEQLKAASARLHELRRRYATELSTAIMRELNELHFNDAVFETRIEECAYSPPEPIGWSFSSAPTRVKPKPLASIASGGELSRIMLAIKRIIGDLDRIPTMIFDEIDTGISGAAAGVVGRKLRQISETARLSALRTCRRLRPLANTTVESSRQAMSEARTRRSFP